MQQTTLDSERELRLAALDRAINYHAHLEHIGTADDVVVTAARFGKYLTEEEHQ
jgi:hypothetical protein